MTGIIEYFNTDGEMREEAGEFEGLDMEPFIDKRLHIMPNYVSPLTGVMQFDLENGTEVSFYRQPNVIYGAVTYSNGIKLVLFKCRQRKNLTRFISRVLQIGSWELNLIPRDFRIDY